MTDMYKEGSIGDLLNQADKEYKKAIVFFALSGLLLGIGITLLFFC